MLRTDYDAETIPLVLEGEHTVVLGAGEVAGKIAVAQTPIEIMTNPIFDEPGVIPVLLDEFCVTDKHRGSFAGVARKLRSGLWAGFVTLGSSELIKSRRLRAEEPSHFMIFLRDLSQQEGFIVVVDNDEENQKNSLFLRSEVGMYHEVQSVLRVKSSTSATIEFDIDS